MRSYDFAGGWSPRTGLHAPLFDDGVGPPEASAGAAVRGYREAGVPRRKIVLGLPFHGRTRDPAGWLGGRGDPVDGSRHASRHRSSRAGAYRDRALPNPAPRETERRETESQQHECAGFGNGADEVQNDAEAIR
jgi:GH18 family chitinase